MAGYSLALVTVFAQLVRLGFTRWSTYRMATLGGAVTNTVFGLIRASITMATVAAAGGALAGYDATQAATYAWLTQAVIAPVHVFGWTELAVRVRTGDVAVDLARPVDPQLAFLAADLGRAGYSVLPRGLPPLLAGALVTGLALPTDAAPYALGALALLLAVLISFTCRWLVNLIAFWTVEVRGHVVLYVTIMNLLSGQILPVHWFPAPMAAVAAATPFPSMVQAPVDLLTGRATGTQAAAVLATQAGWLLALTVAARLVQARATSRLVVQGG